MKNKNTLGVIALILGGYYLYNNSKKAPTVIVDHARPIDPLPLTKEVLKSALNKGFDASNQCALNSWQC
jgi:hypothetical protein